MRILTINAGSSSIKYKVFHTVNNALQPFIAGLIDGIGEAHGQWRHEATQLTCTQHTFASHQHAFEALSHELQQTLQGGTLDAVGHRIVHGGNTYWKPTRITPEVLKTIQEIAYLAPLHNPVNALGVEYAQHYFPDTQHVALFDSGFHHTLPEFVHTYAIDQEIAKKYQVRRYGFHGINHEYVAEQAATWLDKPLSECNFISLHLGNGASACLIQQGQSVDTTMGMTPLAGLIMGTRCGDIDPAIPLYLQRQGLSLQEVDELLNKRSGLLGIGQDNDMRRLMARSDAGDTAAALAIQMFVHSIQKTIGAYYSQTPQLHGVIFTGGIGENAPLIRESILDGLAHFHCRLDTEKNLLSARPTVHNIAANGIPLFVIQGDEERFIASKVNRLLNE